LAQAHWETEQAHLEKAYPHPNLNPLNPQKNPYPNPVMANGL
jgi:hypothetical protein